ncbi:MAG: T9SS type A sorting domain-containing protein [Saprospiraceae bacterium]|nr:T9SS type A sorting domain-containing protein [Saprospiraceae bacterium]
MRKSMMRHSLYFILRFIIFLSTSIVLTGQTNCISGISSACVGDCQNIEYIGPGSDVATYSWSISCGTISNPDQKNPHIACFLSPGLCSIQVIWQEPGQAPETCAVQIEVFPIPTGSFNRLEDTICRGNCTTLSIAFTGTGPFSFEILANNVSTRHTSNIPNFSLQVCPVVNTVYQLTNLADQFCTNTNLISKESVLVNLPINATVDQIHNELCASPPNLTYHWFACNTTTVLSTSQCFAPPQDGCYCAVISDRHCIDTVCVNFRCNLTCSFKFPDTITVGDTALIYYTGNGGPNTKFDWIIDIGNLIPLHFSGTDSLWVIYNLPGCFPIQLGVQEGSCISRCIDTICVISKECACNAFTKNQIKPNRSSPQACCYDVLGDVSSSTCFTSIQVHLSSGSFANVNANTNQGWSVSQPGFQVLQFSHNSGFIPPGNFNAGNFCVNGASNYTISVRYFFTKSGLKDTCTFSYIFDCPQAPRPAKCDSLISYLEKQHTLPAFCCFNIQTDNPKPNNFNKIKVLLSSGSFNNVTANTSQGFNLIPGGPKDFSLTHVSGFIPKGQSQPGSFCVTVANNPVIVTILYYFNTTQGTDSCVFKFIFDCPGGTNPIPTCCDSLTAQLLSFGPQPTCCYDFRATNSKSNCFTQICFKTNSGNFSNIIPNAGWTSSITPSGFCFIPNGIFVPPGSINPGTFCVTSAVNPFTITVDFIDANGMKLDSCQKKFVRECPKPPPACTCDSLKSFVIPKSTVPGKCCYNITGNVPTGNCYTKIQVLLSSGTFTNIVANAGYNVSINNSQDFNLIPNAGFIPSGFITPASFCVTGSGFYTITLIYYFNNGGLSDTCLFKYSFDCPQPPSNCNCDSLKNTLLQTSAIPGTCCYKMQGNIPSANCFTEIQVVLSAGSFSNILPGNGWNVITNSPQNFYLNHNPGNIPIGPINPAEFCVKGASLYSITIIYYYNNNGALDTCSFKYSFDCPSIPKSCSCDSLKNSVIQTSVIPGLCCYALQGNVPSSNCFTQIKVSLNSGSFSNIQAGSGWNAISSGLQNFSLNHNSGSIPSGPIMPANFCVTGSTFYIITVTYYYNNNGVTDTCQFKYTFDCPSIPKTCTCDSLKSFVNQTSALPGLCCYELKGIVPTQNCFTNIQVLLSAGSFTNVQATNGYTIVSNGPTDFYINPNNGFIPAGSINPGSFCVSGSTVYTITIHYFINSGGLKDTCSFYYSFDCPQSQDTLCNQSSCVSGNMAWQAIASGVTQVYDMAVFQCKLIVAGQFLQIGNTIVNNIAAWDGTNWTALNQGVNGTVRSLAVHNGILYVGGQFTAAGTLTNVNNIAAWNGSNWAHLDNGVTGPGSVFVGSLLSTLNGLVVGGSFQTAGQTANISTNNIAAWNGSSWINSNFNSSFNGPIYTLRQFNNQIYAAGTFTLPHLNISRWNGTIWNNLASGINLVNNVPYNGVNAQYVFNNELFVGGHFLNADNVPMTQHIAHWNGVNWLPVSGGDFQNSTEAVNDFIKYNNKLYVGGEFSQVGNQFINGVAEWNGTNWFTTNHLQKVVRSLETYDSCGTITCELYAAGEGFINRWKCLTSNKDLNHEVEFYIRPNPVADQVQIFFGTQELPKNGLIQILDLQGNKLQQIEIKDQAFINLDVSHFTSGIYIVEFKNNNRRPYKQRFVKM